jgi:hypothetical protein
MATRSGAYAVFVDSQSYGSQMTGGNFAIMLLARDDLDRTSLVEAA